MTTILLTIAWIVKLAMLVVLVGVFVQRRHRQCRSFVVYVLMVLGCESLMALWPGRFFNPEFWMIRQALYDAAKLLVALELAWRTLRAFPGALHTGQLAALVLLPVAVVVMVSFPTTAGFGSVAEWAPRMVVGTIAVFTMTAVLALWYHLPIRPWHRALIMGFSGYLLVFTVLFNLLRIHGWTIVGWFNLADGFAYLGLSIWWAVEAWRSEPVLVNIPISVQRRLGLVEPERA